MKKFLLKLILVIIIIGAVSSVSFYIGFEKGKKNLPPVIIDEFKNTKPKNIDEKIDFSLFWQVYGILKQNFIYADKIDSQKVLYGAISGMVKSLGDPYTVFLDPERAKIFREDVSGEFEGVGMEIGIRKNTLTVIAPLEGTPAFKAGIKPGDIITAIDGKSTEDMTLEEAVKLIRGKAGTTVILTIVRDEFKEPKDFKITREKIYIPLIKYEVKEDNIAYIKIYSFSANLTQEFTKTAYKILSDPNIKGIIIDLRNNPGGFLQVAVDVTGWFLDEQDTIVIEQFDGNRNNVLYKSKGPSLLKNYPLVILINQGSASASEIMAGAIKDNRENVKIVGEKSFGKGSVQELRDLPDGSAVKFTVAKWLTPKGNVIEENGIKPDIEVKYSEDEEKDTQLEKAIEVLKGLINN